MTQSTARRCWVSGALAGLLAAAPLFSQITPWRPAVAGSNWQHVTSLAGAFSVNMPVTPAEQSRQMQVAGVNITFHNYVYKQGAEVMLVMYADLDSSMKPSSVVAGFRDEFRSSGSIAWEQDLRIGGNPGKDIKGSYQGQSTEILLAVAGSRVYVVWYQSGDYLNEIADREPFFTSFHIHEPQMNCSFAIAPVDGPIVPSCLAQ